LVSITTCVPQPKNSPIKRWSHLASSRAEWGDGTDLPSLEAIPLEEDDPHVNPLGIKGVGEIGITGTTGAVANAVWHATGVRVREMPITLDKLLWSIVSATDFISLAVLAELMSL